MQVRYRIIEEVSPNGTWQVAGVVAMWLSEAPHLQLRAMLAHTVSRSIWRKVQQRVTERQLTLHTYQDALEEYGSYYRIKAEVYEVEAQTSNEIRRYFREKYLFSAYNEANEAIPQRATPRLLAVMA